MLYATLAVPIARLADRGKRTRLLGICVALWSAMTALVSTATGFGTLVILRMGVALGEAGSGPISHAIIGDIVPVERRGRALAVMALAVPTGTMLGFLSAGWLATVLGWRMTFLVLGGIGLAAAPLVWAIRDPRHLEGITQALAAGDRRGGLVAALNELWRIKPFRFVLLAATLHSFTLYGYQNWAASFYIRVHHISLTQVGTALALIFGVGGGVGALLGGHLVDRLGRRDAVWFGRVPAIAGAFAAPFLVSQFLVRSIEAALTFGLVATFLMNVFIAPANATAQACVPSGMRALTSATLLAVPSIVGVGLAPLLIGMISDRLVAIAHDPAAIRYAILVPVCALPAAALLFELAGRAARRRFATAGLF